jgi:hypothetical protein
MPSEDAIETGATHRYVGGDRRYSCWRSHTTFAKALPPAGLTYRRPEVRAREPEEVMPTTTSNARGNGANFAVRD